MTKVMLSMSLISLFKKKMTLNIMMIMSLLMLLILTNLNLKYMTMSSIFMMDPLSMLMMLLTTISIMLIILSSSIMKKISYTIIPIFIILMITFLSKNSFMFYISFEMVLIPTLILITMNGKQMERLQAGIYLIIYTVMASLPMLFTMIFFKMNMSFTLMQMSLMKIYIMMFMMLAFLAKMPMYFIHLWLPKAHVEAPLEGSMILAAVLLKLGGYGIIRFMPVCMMTFNKMNYWIMSISLIGATATSLNCIRQKDIKSLIAYSSVAHMGFTLTGLFSMNYIGLVGAILMMIGHGMSSSALFLLANDLYSKYHTRNMMMFKGLMTIMPNITFWWFMFMALNISAPPSINTFSEIFMMSSIILWSNNTMLMIFIMTLMSATFSLMMFINIIHNKINMLITSETPQKIFMSLYIHLIPTIILIMKMDIMYI